jgi:hypothetical protein
MRMTRGSTTAQHADQGNARSETPTTGSLHTQITAMSTDTVRASD